MKKLMTALLGLSFLTGLAAVSFARPDDPAPAKKEEKKKKSSKKKKEPKKDDATK
jgi:hypothetical protein